MNAGTRIYAHLSQKVSPLVMQHHFRGPGHNSPCSWYTVSLGPHVHLSLNGASELFYSTDGHFTGISGLRLS
jgi:hypothetical protein